VEITRFYRKPALSVSGTRQLLDHVQNVLGFEVPRIRTETCYYVESDKPLTRGEIAKMRYLLAETFEPQNLARVTFLSKNSRKHKTILEVGSRLSFETPWSSSAVAICHRCGITKVNRIERSVRIALPVKVSDSQKMDILKPLYDRMTQAIYDKPLRSFDLGVVPEPVRTIPVLEEGPEVLYRFNVELGCAWDDADIMDYIYPMFAHDLKRNPTDVELFQIAQSTTAEHSRHWFFKGELVIDGEPVPEKDLMEIIKTPWKRNPGNSVIAFDDDSSAIRGSKVKLLMASDPSKPSQIVTKEVVAHPTLTAETHNFPSGIAPYPGAATGTGGRIRDNQAVGRGGLVGVGGTMYCVGHLRIPGYDLPWEQDGWWHSRDLASPLDIKIKASNGASDYGNCFGEPVIYGSARSFAMKTLDSEYRAWHKPIMYTVGAGRILDDHIKKGQPESGMIVAQVGGPPYLIGMGGGSASSMSQGENKEDLNHNAAQRGNPEMEQRMNRFMRACIELGEANPIISAHDLGAGGDCNALPEIVDPAGAIIKLRNIPVGDKTLSVLGIWGNESQERNAILVWPDKLELLKKIASRENVPLAVVGEVTGDGQLVVVDDNDGSTPVNLPLGKILGELPRKTFRLTRKKPVLKPLEIPKDLTVDGALCEVMRLVSVGSKRFLTTKVDRSVTGLIAQQQCVGPNQLTLSDYAVIADSYQEKTSGVALSIGEKPIIGLINPKAGVRMSFAEALFNMAPAVITKREDIRLSLNWMALAKKDGEGADIYDGACAARDICLDWKIAIDGGKDSLSMASKVTDPYGNVHTAKAPMEAVAAFYAPMPDVTCKVTPDLKEEGNFLLLIDSARGKNRLGGSAFAYVNGQLGDEVPDVDDPMLVKRSFEAIQELVKAGMIVSAHDRIGDGGLLVNILEMAFAGNCGLNLDLTSYSSEMFEVLFSEEAGMIVECKKLGEVMAFLAKRDIPSVHLGEVGRQNGMISLNFNNETVLQKRMVNLREIWEETSSRIDELQANPECVRQERSVNSLLIRPLPHKVTFQPISTSSSILNHPDKPKVAMLREQGTNGDREMTAAFMAAGFDVWDVITTDIIEKRITMDSFRGLVLPGGFSFGDVLDAGKGWAAVARFNPILANELAMFFARPDTFSFGVCNGCQAMALIGVPGFDLPDEKKFRFIQNVSDRFESRYSAVKIMDSPAIMLKGMAGSILPIWVAHGEGRFYCPDEEVLDEILFNNLAPIRYVDSCGSQTTVYPFNPNGSTDGIAAICSSDGRHLIMMPHPERGYIKWQLAHISKEWQSFDVSPLLRMFQNAYAWCMPN